MQLCLHYNIGDYIIYFYFLTDIKPIGNMALVKDILDNNSSSCINFTNNSFSSFTFHQILEVEITSQQNIIDTMIVHAHIIGSGSCKEVKLAFAIEHITVCDFKFCTALNPEVAGSECLWSCSCMSKMCNLHVIIG